MEIKLVAFDEAFTFNVKGQEVTMHIWPLDEPSNLKFGIDAPRDVVIVREEIGHQVKTFQKKSLYEPDVATHYFKQKLAIFQTLSGLEFKSEKLERVLNQLYPSKNFLTPKELEAIAQGEKSSPNWLVVSAIHLLIDEMPNALGFLSPKALYTLWAKPLIRKEVDRSLILNHALRVRRPELIELITLHQPL